MKVQLGILPGLQLVTVTYLILLKINNREPAESHAHIIKKINIEMLLPNSSYWYTTYQYFLFD